MSQQFARRLSFASPIPLCVEVNINFSCVRTCVRRRPRTQGSSRRPRVSAVFLPPSESPFFKANGEDARRGRPSDTDQSDGESSVLENNGNEDVVRQERESRSNLDEILKDTAPEYDTWISRNERRSLATVRGRSEHNLGADELNESLRPDHLDKLRYVLKPDEEFGVIFSWDTVFENSRKLEAEAWKTVAEEEGLIPPDMDDILRAETMAPEAAVQRVFYWTSDWKDIKRLVFRKFEIYEQLFLGWQFTKWPGIDAWLESLSQYGISSVLCSERPRARMEEAVKQVGLSEYFPSNRLIAVEDEFQSMEQMLLIAAIKVHRPPAKCLFFTDKPTGISASREVSSQVVAMIGAHPAYDVKTADMTVTSYSDLVLYHVRSLFSQNGAQLTDPETELEVLV